MISLVETHRRYRAWAARFGQGPILVVGMGAGLAGAVLMSLAGPELRPVIFWKVLPWFALLAGPLAAFDAWGAAVHRARPREGLARALLILAICWGFALWALVR